MARVLVIRLSALGDVAISVPLVHALAEQFPEHEFLMVSQPRMAGLFEHCPPNVIFKPADIYGRHKGIAGLYRLYREIGPKTVDVICDMHNVLRTRVFCLFFTLNRIPVFRMDKQRHERRLLTRRKNKVLLQLKTSFERYRDVFARAGLSLNYFDFWPKMGPSQENLPELEKEFGSKKQFWLGFAPFARHEGKIYPLDKSEKVLSHFANDARFKVFLFGGGKEEMQRMCQWKERYPSVQLPTGKTLSEEIKLISCLDLMFAMDSANMHLSSLAHTSVVSVWGATHSFAGFNGLFQAERTMIQTDLSCRPCSVFGNKPCFRKDYACMNELSPEEIIERIEKESEVHSLLTLD
jgi:ADP-heptose:LPS heptosyltransferase